MLKSVELKKSLEETMNKIETLRAENKVDEVRQALQEAKNLQEEIKVQEQIEADEAANFTGGEIMNKTVKADATVAFNKALLGKGLTESENALVEKVDEDGGYLVPREQKTQIEELKRALIPLKGHCNVIPVGTMAGSMPLEVEAGDKLVDFDELAEMNQSTIKFGQVSWKLKNKGDIIPISNILLQDEKANLTNYVGRRFAKKAVRAENADIIAELAKAEKVAGTDYKAIDKTLNVHLDPSIAAGAIIVTDQDGFDYLDGLEDTMGRKLLSDDLKDATIKRYKGKQILVMPNGTITKEEGKLNYFVGDMAEYVSFFDRGVYEMATSKEAGFTRNTTYMRVIERYDVKVVDTKAMRNVELTIAAEAAARKAK